MSKTENQHVVIPGLTPEGISKKGSRKGLNGERKLIVPIGEEKLKESQKMLQKLAGHLDEIIENERSRIALNLHDDLGQKLTAINMNIAWVKSRIGVQSPAVRKKLEEMSQMVNETVESIKEISSFLRPLILFDLGVVPAFDSLLKKFYKQSGIDVSLYMTMKNFRLTNVSH